MGAPPSPAELAAENGAADMGGGLSTPVKLGLLGGALYVGAKLTGLA
jgi:hypothetical protein